jgi:ABC-2 type transport system permease protein
MPLLLTIARKEVRDVLRDGRFRVLSVVVVLVSLISLGAGWKQYHDISRQHGEAQASTRTQWVNQPPKNPHSAAHYGIYAFKPKSQLAILDTGIDPYVGVATWLEAHRQNEAAYRPAQDRTAVQRFGELTGAEVLQILVPLFIVLMTFSAFSAERERGMLRQVLSLGVPRHTLAAGKVIGVATALGLILLPVIVIAAAALALSSGGVLASTPARALWLAVVYLAYVLTVIAIALAVSARAPSSRVALIVLLTLWFVNSLVAPRAVGDLAAAVRPTPSAVEFRQAMQRDLGDTAAVQRRLEQRKQELFARHGVDTVEALPVAFSGISLQEGEEHANEVFDEHYGRLHGQYARQDAVYQWAGLAAPMLAVRSLSMGLAGTDFSHHRHFITAAEHYRRDMQRVLNGDLAQNQKPGQVYLADRGLWERIAPFDYDAPSTGWALAGQTRSLLALGVWLAGSFLVLGMAVRTMGID